MEENVKKEINLFLEKMTFPAVISVEKESENIFRISFQTQDARFLIGSQGETIESVEILLKKIIQRKIPDFGYFYIDINDYRRQRQEFLKENAKQSAKQVRLYRKDVVLEPMSSFERRIVHVVLSEYPDIKTESIGEGLERRVVIKPFQ